MSTRSMAVTGSCSIGKCGRLSQPSWLLVPTIYSLTYLLTYLGSCYDGTTHYCYLTTLTSLSAHSPKPMSEATAAPSSVSRRLLGMCLKPWMRTNGDLCHSVCS